MHAPAPSAVGVLPRVAGRTEGRTRWPLQAGWLLPSPACRSPWRQEGPAARAAGSHSPSCGRWSRPGASAPTSTSASRPGAKSRRFHARRRCGSSLFALTAERPAVARDPAAARHAARVGADRRRAARSRIAPPAAGSRRAGATGRRSVVRDTLGPVAVVATPAPPPVAALRPPGPRIAATTAPAATCAATTWRSPSAGATGAVPPGSRSRSLSLDAPAAAARSLPAPTPHPPLS